MPRKKGWLRAKRMAEEQEQLQAAGTVDQEYCSLPKKKKTHYGLISSYDWQCLSQKSSYKEVIPIFCWHTLVHDTAENEEFGAVVHDDTNVAETVDVTFDHFDNMYCELTKSIKHPYTVTNGSDTITIVEMYDSTMKLFIFIKRDLTFQLYVHNRLVSKGNAVFEVITDGELNVATIIDFLTRWKTSHFVLKQRIRICEASSNRKWTKCCWRKPCDCILMAGLWW